jgi:hypothetical protein
MRFAILTALIPVMAAQAQVGSTLAGTVLERDPNAAAGQFSVRAASNQVFRYRFDAGTTVERDSRPADVARLQPGDRVEVTSDLPPGAALRYAVSVRVLAVSSPPRAAPSRTAEGSADRETGFGGTSFSGVVAQLADGRMTLRLRDGSEKVLTLRQDTTYMAAGKRVDAGTLKPATRVFVEAGRSILGPLEAYRVVWGDIMQPK